MKIVIYFLTIDHAIILGQMIADLTNEVRLGSSDCAANPAGNELDFTMPDIDNEKILIEEIAERAARVEWEESKIDEEDKVYLLTWSPNPQLLPDTDFINQHLFNVNFIADFLKCCYCGLACVEATQKGNPHYHLWYQLSDDAGAELARIAHIKTMEKFGNMKGPVEAAYVIKNCYYERKNALYYYKEDLFDLMLMTPHNPIHSYSYCDKNWNASFFFSKEQGCKKIADLVSRRATLRQFYSDSDL